MNSSSPASSPVKANISLRLVEHANARQALQTASPGACFSNVRTMFGGDTAKQRKPSRLANAMTLASARNGSCYLSIGRTRDRGGYMRPGPEVSAWICEVDGPSRSSSP